MQCGQVKFMATMTKWPVQTDEFQTFSFHNFKIFDSIKKQSERTMTDTHVFILDMQSYKCN